MQQTTAPRTVLFLQGPPSPIWTDLAEALEARGAAVRRVEFCLADQLFWRRGGAVRYRGRLSGWRRWLLDYCRREGVSDILYYADQLPYHRIAAKAARALGIDAHAMEFGYLRPDWLTLEREGGGAFSHFPNTPDAMASDAPPPDMKIRYPHAFSTEAIHEVAYNLLMTAGRPLYPFYVTDKYYPPIFDYLCWLPKLAMAPWRKREAARLQAAHAEGGAPFFLVALQMQSDYQLRRSAPYAHQGDMIRELIASFAEYAPPDARLLFKVHPLDNGWEGWRRVAGRAAAAVGAAERVSVIDGGDLNTLIRGASGVLAANSTVGLHALRAGRPMKAMGAAVYDMEGLTDQQALSAYWRAPQPPDPQLLARYMATLANEIQVKGSMYLKEGRLVAAAEMAARIVEGRVGPSGPRMARPPRLAALEAARRSMRAD